MTDKPKRKHNPAWYDPPENVARRNREARARKKKLLDDLAETSSRFGLTLAELAEGLNSGRITIVVKENQQ